jgi:hypothetical protein
VIIDWKIGDRVRLIRFCHKDVIGKTGLIVHRSFDGPASVISVVMDHDPSREVLIEVQNVQRVYEKEYIPPTKSQTRSLRPHSVL